MRKVIRNPLMTLMMLILASIFPDSASAAGWTVNPADFRYDMSLYFELSFKSTGVPTDLSNYEVASFVGNDCRGVSETLPGVSNCLYMRIRSNSASGEALTFKFMDKTSGEVTEIEGVTLNFESGKAIGLPSNPYKLEVTAYYDVNVTATSGGSTDLISGRYPEGTQLTVTATPDEKFRFVKWSDGDTQQTRNLTVNADINLQAIFEKYIFTITYIVDGNVYKTVDAEAGSAITPETAPDKEGHQFNGWEGLPETMPAEDITVTAKYTRLYNVTITATQGGKTDFTSGTFPEGTQLTVTATPDEKFRFVKWSDGDTQQTRNLTVNADINLQAIFEKYIFTITYIVDGNVYKTVDTEAGTTITPETAPDKEGHQFNGWEGLPETMPAEDITVTAKYTRLYNVTITATQGGKTDFTSGTFPEGTQLTVTATPDEKFRFVKWSDGDTQQTRNLTVNADINLQAIFEKYIFTITYIVDGNVYKTVDAEAGTTITPETAPDKEGHQFNGWEGLPETMPAEDITVTAKYTRFYNVTITATQGGKTDFTSGTFPEGTQLTVTATPDEKFRFVKWSDGDTQQTRNLTVNADINLQAIFEKYIFTITYIVDGNVYKTVDAEAGTTITPETAPDKEGHQFNGWEGLPETMPAEDITVTAKYTRFYNVTITATQGGKTDFTSGTFPEGTQLTVTATPDEKFRFVKWSDGDTQQTRNLTVNADINLQAIFEKYIFTITYIVDGNVYKTVDAEAGTTITPETAPDKEGHQFNGWEGLPETMPAEDITVTAKYTRFYNVTITATQGGKTDFTSGTFPEGTQLTVTATPDEKFRFVKWSDGDTQQTRNLTVNADINLQAIFEKYIFTITYIVDGNVYKTVDTEAGTAITPETAPDKEGHQFNGWEGLPETMPAEDITVTAKYTAILYSLTVYLDNEIYFEAKLEMGAEIQIPTPELPADRVFNGWQEEIPETMPAHDLEIHGTTTANSGLQLIFNDENTTLTVYNIQGSLLLKGVTVEEALEKLPRGIYIINGVKVAI